MELRHNALYRLPDGTRVRAVDLLRGTWRLDSTSGEPLYILNRLGFRRFVPEGSDRYVPGICDLTLDDLTPDAH